MSTRTATRILTGRPVTYTELVLGRRPDGSPGATLHACGTYKAYAVPIKDPAIVRGLIADLVTALYYLEDSE